MARALKDGEQTASRRRADGEQTPFSVHKGITVAETGTFPGSFATRTTQRNEKVGVSQCPRGASAGRPSRCTRVLPSRKPLDFLPVSRRELHTATRRAEIHGPRRSPEVTGEGAANGGAGPANARSRAILGDHRGTYLPEW